MKFLSKIGRVLATIIPRSYVGIERSGGRAYMLIVEREWLARKTRVEVEVRDAEKTEMNILDLL